MPAEQRPFRLHFTGREAELARGLEFLSGCAPSMPSGLLRVIGDSGTGKTYLCKELLYRHAHSHPHVLSLYMDVQGDEFASTRLYESLICRAWNNYTAVPDEPLNIPRGTSYSEHLVRLSVETDVVHYLYRAVMRSADLLPGYGPALRAVLPQPSDGEQGQLTSTDIASAFFDYLETMASAHPVVMVLDNYQFIPQPLRMLTESRLASITTGLVIIPIDRTTNGRSDIAAPLCFPERRLELALRGFSYEETLRLVESQFPDETEHRGRIARDCFAKTQGNLKEIHLYATKLLMSPPSGRATVETFVSTIASLSSIERSLLGVASLFPAGMKLSYVLTALRKLASLQDAEHLEGVVHELVALGYLVLNSRSGDLLRPAHEKVVTTVQATLREDELLEIRRLAVQGFDEILSDGVDRKEYTYLLHCLIGILNAREVVERIDRVIELIDLQHRTDAFHYLVWLYKNNEVQSLMPYFPRHVVEAFLDAFQKTSEFDLGIAAVQRLITNGGGHQGTLALYKAKYLSQIYRYNEALEILDTLPDNDVTLLYRLNVLQCLCEDEGAVSLVDGVRRRTPLRPTPEVSIILRNSAHLYAFDDAHRNLLLALNYFRASGARFEEATVLNNLGVIHAWAGDYESATRSLEVAHSTMEKLASNEVYQALINLGVVSAVQERFRDALSFFERARRKIPSRLLLDQLILESNIELSKLALKTLDASQAAEDFLDFYAASRQILDPRLHGQLAYNCRALSRAVSGASSVEPDTAFSATIESRERTGFEILTRVGVGDASLPVLFIMSPHWRY